MDPQSTRAQFTEVTTPGEPNEQYTSKANHLPSPLGALELDTPRTVEVTTGDGIATGAWAAGLFDCFDSCVPNCFMVTFCPCVALAQLSTRLGVASYRIVLGLLLLVTVLELVVFAFIWTADGNDSDDSPYYSYRWQHRNDSSSDDVLNGTFVMATLFVQVLLFVYIWQLRAKTRSRFQLPGNAASDCLSSCTFGSPDTLQAYPGKSYAV
ncbi:hypothetical protein BBJ29_009478 [Phytophthora kernoviae]|uniref:PLAC8 family protein n=1 Tax=Phytophthora kernoviae TaxID=325452 RepID=A0A3F2REG5_9STRA|nr:hypothetical protein BBJ29_009478 [Phytophthora kernoviae]RLN54721.1 hypothetical protein BBP00_00008808 [Phytophthora kernoviae]